MFYVDGLTFQCELTLSEALLRQRFRIPFNRWEVEAGGGWEVHKATSGTSSLPWGSLLGPFCSDLCWLWWSVCAQMEQTLRTIPDSSLPAKLPPKRPRVPWVLPPHRLAAPHAQQTCSGVTVISLDLRNRRATGETTTLPLPEELCHFISMMSECMELFGV